jgi:hypothetical protein
VLLKEVMVTNRICARYAHACGVPIVAVSAPGETLYLAVEINLRLASKYEKNQLF